MFSLKHLWIAILIVSFKAFAMDIPLREDLNEQVLMIPVDKTFYGSEIKLETTLFKPDGNGPFPLLVINHGKDSGFGSSALRERMIWLSREFLKRGYAVALPMQRGFSKSDGLPPQLICNYLPVVEQAGEDIKAVVNYLTAQPFIRADQVIVAGQSFGGLNTIAFAQNAPAGVKLILNFAGGLRFENSAACNSEELLIGTFGELAKGKPAPSLWFYGKNDGLFPPALVRDIYKKYSANHQQAELMAYGDFHQDAHGMFGSPEGFNTIWWPVVEKRLKSLSMPTAVIHLQYDQNRPKPTGYAEAGDLQKLPNSLGTFCKKEYERLISNPLWLTSFAISNEGGCGFGQDEVLAMKFCEQHSKFICQLYLVENQVVWPKGYSN